MASALPKLSYVLLAYNREQYIREAVESAFAQEYEGELEYIFSDDCSTDNTYAIMQECVAAYTGSRRVVLTQTPQNGNLALHACHAVRFAKGDWIVRADDDDLSFPDRCQHVADAIRRFPDALCFLEPLQSVGDEQCVPENVRLSAGRRPMWEGYTYGWETLRDKGHCFPLAQTSVKTYARMLYSYMGELPPEASADDDVTLAYRALSCGRIAALSGAPSILYRRNFGSMSGTTDGDASLSAIRRKEEKIIAIQTTHAHGLCAVLRQYREYLSGLKETDAEYPVVEYLAVKMIPALLSSYEAGASWWTMSTWQRLRHWSREKASMSKYTFALARTLPYPLAVCGYSALKTISNELRRCASLLEHSCHRIYNAMTDNVLVINPVLQMRQMGSPVFS